MKLIYKLTSGFLLVTILIAVTSYISIKSSRDALQKSIEENSIIFAQEILDKIDRSIYNRIESMQAYAYDTMLQSLVLKSNKEFDAMDDPQAYIDQKDKEWRAVQKETITPFMNGLISEKSFKELKDRGEFYEEKYGYKVYAEIFVTNKYGANAGQTGKTSDYYQADEDWWQQAKNSGLHVSDIAYDESADTYSIDVVKRVEDKQGNFIGIIKAVIDIEEVINILKGIATTHRTISGDHVILKYGHGNHKSMDFKLLTREGKLIYNSDKEETVLLKNISAELLSHLTSTKTAGAFITDGDSPGEGEELISHAHSIGYKKFQGFGWIFFVMSFHSCNYVFLNVKFL